MNLVHYSNCPVCSSSNIFPLLTVTDLSVSKTEFVIWQCGQCQLRFTQDVPAEAAIAPYYQSVNYISHSNTSKGLLNKIYKRVRQFTLRQKAELIIKNTVAKGNLLDVGAGIGAFVYQMQKSGWQATGIEPDAGARRQALQVYGLQLQHTPNLEQLPKAHYDAITLWHVLEHVHALHAYLEKLKSLLKPGGKLFVAVPNYQSVDAGAYGNFWAAYDVPRHLYHFTPKAMEVLMQKHQLNIVEKKPMWFDAFYISLLSSRYRSGKTRWLQAGKVALHSNIKAAFNKNYCSSIIYIIQKV